MLRKPIAVLLVVVGLRLGAATPEGSLELGMRAFRAGDYASAIVDLGAAASIPPADLQTYVAARQMDRLQSFETALVYLALAQFRLGGEDDAHQTILRLVAADRAAPVYANLPLQSDAAEFETLRESHEAANADDGRARRRSALGAVRRGVGEAD